MVEARRCRSVGLWAIACVVRLVVGWWRFVGVRPLFPVHGCVCVVLPLLLVLSLCGLCEALRCCRVRYVIGPPRVLVGCRNSRLSFCRRFRSAGGVRASVVATFCRSHTRDVIVRVIVVSASGRLSHDPAESVRHTWCHTEFSSGRLTVTPGDVDGVCSLASRRVRLLPRHVTTSPASFKVEPNLSLIGATVIGRVSLQVDTAGIPCILIQWES